MTSKYRVLAEEIERSIDRGVFGFGQKLPSVRALSRTRRVSTATVVQAYQLLESQDLIAARPRSGYFVSRDRTAHAITNTLVGTCAPQSVDEFDDLMPELLNEHEARHLVRLGVSQLEADLIAADELKRHARAVLRMNSRRIFEYPPVAGLAVFRRRICELMHQSGAVTSPRDVLVTNGCQEALWIAFQCVARRGSVVAVESPCYPGVLKIIQALELRAIEIPSDRNDGLDLDRLRSAVRDYPIAALYVMPNCSNPTGAVYPEDSKDKLYDVAAAHDLMIIEDDSNRDLYFGARGLSSIKARDSRGLVTFCSSFSKTVAPSIRIGWMAPGQISGRAKDLKYALNLTAPSQPQLMLEHFIADGGYRRQLLRAKATLADTMKRLGGGIQSCWPSARFKLPQGGTFLWIELAANLNSIQLRDRALERGVSIAPGTLFSPFGSYKNFVRLGWGGAWNDQVDKAVRKLGEVIGDLTAADVPSKRPGKAHRSQSTRLELAE